MEEAGREVVNFFANTRECWKKIIDGSKGPTFYENRPLNRHGAEGDTVIGKAYIYDKYIDENGRYCLKICGWGEDLEGNIVEVVPMEAVLPSRDFL